MNNTNTFVYKIMFAYEIMAERTGMNYNSSK